MQEKICSVFGHSQINKEDLCISVELRKVLIDIITKHEVTTFYFGGFGEFDTLCYEIITDLKKEYTYIKRVYCLEDEKYLKKYKHQLDYNEYEDYILLPLAFDYWRTKIYYRNCSMIDNSDIVLFYIRKTENSGAYKAFKYAQKNKKQLISI